jgi:hypothetical protein
MNWDPVVRKVMPFVVKIETPSGSGTGFLCGYTGNKSLCLIATALHVVSQCDEWQQPIKLHNIGFQKTTFLKESDRVIFKNYARDSAVLLIPNGQLIFPEELIKLRPMESPVDIGCEVGWLGYPGIASSNLCFFQGNISARLEDRSAYLIDGVAINGVSGGPVFYIDPSPELQFVGAISAYHANWQQGQTLPGLSVAQDVSHFHGVIQHVNSLEDAKQRKQELEVAQSIQPAAPDIAKIP